jgi:hypothetical protein
MSLRLVRAVAKVENADELHLARLLVLLRAVDKGKGKTVEGITKLAKLDFLLRYPNCLERVLAKTGKDPSAADIKEYERDSIETKMIRFRYGPWDERYRRWIALLHAKGLVNTFVQGRTVHVGLTDKGKEIAAQIVSLEDFKDLDLRSGLILKSVGLYSATRLKEFIYQTFPEITNMKWGEKIEL